MVAISIIRSATLPAAANINSIWRVRKIDRDAQMLTVMTRGETEGLSATLGCSSAKWMGHQRRGCTRYWYLLRSRMHAESGRRHSGRRVATIRMSISERVGASHDGVERAERVNCKEGAPTLVQRRHAFYVGGYDPQGAEGYYRLFVRESKRFLKVWPIECRVGDLQIDSDDVAYWTIEAAGPNWQVATRYEFLRLEHFLRDNLTQPLTRQLARVAWWAVDDLMTGTLWRISRASWRFAVHLVYLQLMLVL